MSENPYPWSELSREERELVREFARRFDALLDHHGAPPGDTPEERLAAWGKRERALREDAELYRDAVAEAKFYDR